MNRIFIIFALITCIMASVEANPKIDARTIILQDYHSEEILFELDADAQIYPASMTKIMTSIIAFDLFKKINFLLMMNLLYLKMHGDYLRVDILPCL